MDPARLRAPFTLGAVALAMLLACPPVARAQARVVDREALRESLYRSLLDREMTRLQGAYLRELRRLSAPSIRW